MNPERWQQIDRLLQSALECAPGQRSALLAQACAGDEPLRQEVESLIASHERVGNLLETPLSQIAADLLVESKAESAEGRTIGPYKVLARLGGGGMGEVYLAQDPRLDRKIALKLLPAYFTKDTGRLRRFEQEARAASSLNHPNILTIHEIGKVDGLHFIATEFIDGVTLRQHMTGSPSPAARDSSPVMTTRMTLSEVLDIAGQAASALAAAHAAGIVHRDVKPENIMVRRDGYVKVLDFGLAKLTEREATTPNTDAPTKVLVNTNPSLVMGTVSYMSPEQARGSAVDARADIWSLGVVLYEMLAGRVPFEGETPSHVIVSILEQEPPSLGRYAEVPTELEAIINKALRKNKEERYQTVKDLSLDLKSLKQELEVEARLERSVQSDARRSANSSLSDEATKSSGQAAVATMSDKLNKFVEHPTSSAEYILNEIKSHKRSVVLALATVVVAVAAAAYVFYFAKGGEVIDSVAVLPFVNVSADPNTEYLSDGISDSVINSLSQLPNLKVIALNSVLRYKGKQTDPQAVGRELGVRAVLMGRLIQQGDGLSISTELVDVRDNSRLWGQQYDRKLADITAVQTEIAQQISENLRLRLSGEEKKRLTKRYTENGEAYQLFALGRYYGRKRTKEGWEKSIEYLEQAIHKDPAYAPAYAELAFTYGNLGFTGLLPPREARQKEEWAVLKAMAIDDTLAEAHVAMARLRARELNWSAAEEESKHAQELNPNSVDAQDTNLYLVAFGRFDEAMAHLKRARELDPLSPTIYTDIGLVLLFDRQYDRAIEQLRKALEIDPNFVPGHTRLAWVYLAKGMYEEAITEQKKAIDLEDSTGRWRRTALLGYAYALAGKRDEAQKIVDDFKERAKKQLYVSPYGFALIHIGLGDKDQAFAWLEKTYEERPDALAYIKVDPKFDSLRSDPRFGDLLRRMKLAS